MFGLSRKPRADDAALVKRALGPGVVVVLSASCCMSGTHEVDAQLDAVARRSLDARGLDWELLVLTVTQAQSVLANISNELSADQAALAKQVSELFFSAGLGAFPMLLVNQRLVSYGGVPDQALVDAALVDAASVGEAVA